MKYRFGNLLDVLRYGTKLHIEEESTKKTVFDKEWVHSERKNISHEVISSDVTMIQVKNGKLYVSVYAPEVKS